MIGSRVDILCSYMTEGSRSIPENIVVHILYLSFLFFPGAIDPIPGAEAASPPLPRCLRADLEKILIHRNAVASVGRGEVGVDISFHVLTGGGVIDVQ